MSDTSSMTSGIAARYATALFELAKEAKKLPALEKDLGNLSGALDGSDALQELIASPVYSREDAGNAIAALAKKMKLSPMVANTLGLMAAKRRLFVLPATIRAVADMIADHKGEVTAEVVAAKKLSAAQEKKLAAELKKSVGKTVKVETTVDESLIGGLIVKVGSKMIDSSIKSKLANLQNAMKEVG
ncbi:MAG: F0F1 ATP synthase subunit delta [Pseudomonadota bacterium]